MFLVSLVVYQDFLRFWGPWMFWGILLSYFVKCLMISSRSDRVMSIWEENHKVKCHLSHYTKAKYYQHDLSILMSKLVIWLKWCFSDFFAVRLFFSSFYTPVFGRMSLCTALNVGSYAPSLWGLFEILHRRCVYSPPFTFCSIMYLYRCRLMNIYFIPWVII